MSGTVMVVDDEPMIRILVSAALSRSGYKVIVAESPTRAIAILDSLPELELLVTDVVMPEISGCELALLMRQQRPGLKVLFMSGYVAADKLPCLDQNTDFLGKPFVIQELTERVTRMLTLPRPESAQPARRRTHLPT